MRFPRRIVPLAFLIGLTACDSGTSSSPAPTPSPAATRIITVAGTLAFGNVNLGATADLTFTISNSGTATLTVTSLNAVGGTGAAGFTASWTSGTIAAGASQTVTLHFAPTVAQFYSNMLLALSDQTSGNAAISVSGTGVAPVTPPTIVSLTATPSAVVSTHAADGYFRDARHAEVLDVRSGAVQWRIGDWAAGSSGRPLRANRGSISPRHPQDSFPSRRDS